MDELHKYATFSVDLSNEIRKVNNVFSIGRARVFAKGKNRNRTIFDEEAANVLAASIPGTPIVGLFNFDNQDFEGHDENAVAYGFVPLQPNGKWIELQDENGVKQEYYEVDVVIWDGRFTEAKSVLIEGKHLSMEIDRNTMTGDLVRVDGQSYFKFRHAQFAGISILGDDVEPCFKDARFISAYTNMVSAYALYIQEIQRNYKGGIDIMEKENEIVEPEATTEEIIEEVVEETVEETVEEQPEEVIEEPAVEETTEEPVEEEAVETIDDQEETVIVEGEESEFACDDKKAECEKDSEEDKEVCPECGKNPCECEEEFKCNKKEYEAMVSELNDTKAKYEELQEQFNEVNNSLKNYTKKEKLDIINKFSTKIESEELINELTTNVDNYSLEEVESKLGRALIEQMSTNDVEETSKTDNFSLNLDVVNNNIENSAWDLVKRHKSNK